MAQIKKGCEIALPVSLGSSKGALPAQGSMTTLLLLAALRKVGIKPT